ncbi:MAG TPA: multiheme c-type cytochrome [Terriglobales bacterium]|nr:multiheme c-type cytochrome [Terriglobales bacterium]
MPSLSFLSRAFAYFLPASILCLSAIQLHAGAKSSLPASEDKSTTTEMRLLDPGWWPTKGSASREEYAGDAACAGCHAEKTASYASTQMAHAMTPVGGEGLAELARGPVHRTIGSYSYSLRSTPAGPVLSINDGTQSASAAIGWVFGVGEIGRTYVYQQKNRFYESHLSYYTDLQNLDFTTGHARSVPTDLALALGRPIADPGACFGCHATQATTSGHFDPQRLIPGVTCEGCHGPGVVHVALMSAGKAGDVPSMIFNPAKLAPVAAVDFCGACHRTAVDVSFLGISGAFTLRFPAYRLQGSRCWKKPDSRLTCSACHDPHQPLVRDLVSYDKNCLACHKGGAATSTALIKEDENRARTAPACPVAQKECVTCHMPRYRVPEMHATFTDHTIAVYKQKTSFNRSPF